MFFEPVESLPIIRATEHFDPDDSLANVMNAKDSLSGGDDAIAFFPARGGLFRDGIKRHATWFLASASFDDIDGMDGSRDFLVPQSSEALG